MSKKRPPENPPKIVIADPTARRIIETQLRALRTGDASEVVEMLEGGLKAGEPPPAERPSTYHISVPLLAVDGQPCVGRSVNIQYKGEGQTVDLAVNGVVYSLSLMQLATALGSLRNVMPYPGMIPRPSL
jgi:hypothetical protein